MAPVWMCGVCGSSVWVCGIGVWLCGIGVWLCHIGVCVDGVWNDLLFIFK